MENFDFILSHRCESVSVNILVLQFSPLLTVSWTLCILRGWSMDVIFSFKWLNFFRQMWIFSKFARLLRQKVKDTTTPDIIDYAKFSQPARSAVEGMTVWWWFFFDVLTKSEPTTFSPLQIVPSCKASIKFIKTWLAWHDCDHWRGEFDNLINARLSVWSVPEEQTRIQFFYNKYVSFICLDWGPLLCIVHFC